MHDTATYNIVAINSTVSKSLNPTLHISPPSSVGSVLGLKSKGRSFEPALNHFFLPTMFACWHTSLQVKIRNLNDCSVTNQIEYTGFRHDSYLEYIAMLFLS